MRLAMRHRLILVFGLFAAGCAAFDATVSQPAELAGRWARIRPDQSSGDTLVLEPDGKAIDGSSAVPLDGIRWSVVKTGVAGSGLCIGPRQSPHCETFRLEGDTLILGDAAAPRFFRRAR